ncbi:MAG: HelD family protein [Sciscionella sp.]
MEQRHVDQVYRRVSELRKDAKVMRDKGFELADGARNEAAFEQGQMLLARDVMVRHASKLLQALDTEHEGLVFGRLDLTDGETMYVGRIGVRDAEFDNLVTDWRAPAAAAFYQATAEEPMGVIRRRVIRSSAETVIDIDDDLLDAEALPEEMRIVGQGALMASLSRARGEKMHNIVATIQREQDVAIRAPWQGVTEITGGPGTGKTAVALHRAAYLLYRDRRRMGGAGVLVVGPSPVFTNYISRVLPSMGENAVELRALGEVLDEVGATRMDTAEVAAVKGALLMRRVLRNELRQPAAGAPEQMRIIYHGDVLRLDAATLAEVRRTVHAKGHPPNASRVLAAEALLEAFARKAEQNATEDGKPAPDREALIDDLAERIDFHRFVVAWWPLRTPQETLAALADPARLAAAARRLLSAEQVKALAASWASEDFSVADVALLDELRVLLGRPPQRGRNRRGQGFDTAPPYDEYSHVVVDESQDLSPMQWRMIGRRGRYASWTVVGDPVQSSWPEPEEARQAADRAFGRTAKRRRFTLRTNYRNSAEIFELAARVVDRVASPEELPHAVRATGIEPALLAVGEPATDIRAAATELLSSVEGTISVICAMDRVSEVEGWIAGLDPRIRAVGSLQAKGLEYDGVVLFEPSELIAESLTGPRSLYVALTRATQRLTVLSTDQRWLTTSN